jgi:hypothetical protein
MTCRKRIRRCQNRGVPLIWDQLGGYPETAQAASGMEAARSSIGLFVAPLHEHDPTGGLVLGKLALMPYVWLPRREAFLYTFREQK